MAKANTPAKKAETSLTTFDFGATAGAGWENTDGTDFQIPFLNQLQALSPQVADGSIEGARPGMFFNSVTEQLYADAVYLTIALTAHTYVEWRPQDAGGGFVAEHAINSDVVAQAKANATNPLDLRTADGNELVETYKVFALILDGPDGTYTDQVVISFSRTKIKRYKQIMTRLRTFKGSQNIPLFAHRLVMSPTDDQNAAGQKYKNVHLAPAVNNDIAASLIDPGGPQADLLEAANTLREAVNSGSAKANFDTAEGGTGRSSDDDDVVFDA